MDITNTVLSISFGTLLAIASLVLGILGYRLNKQKKEAQDAKDAASKAAKEKEEAVNDAIKLQDIHTEILLVNNNLKTMSEKQDKMAEKQDKMYEDQKEFDKRLTVLEKRRIAPRRAAVVNGNK